MSNDLIPFKNTTLSKLFLALSIFSLVFWLLGQSINIYRFAVIGAIFEMLWLLMLLVLFIMPIIAFVFLVKEKFNYRSFNLYSIIIAVATLLLMIFIHK